MGRRNPSCRLRDQNGKVCRRLGKNRIHASHEPGCPYPESAHHLFAPNARKPSFIASSIHTTLRLSIEDRAFLMDHGGITDGVRRLIARERLIEKRIADELADYEAPPSDDLVV